MTTTTQASYVPSVKEVANGKKVIDILEKIEGIGFEVKREDLVIVSEEESNIEIAVDSEDDVICLIMDVMEVPKTGLEAFYKLLLELNDHSLHGAFSISNGRVILKENLEAENLDQNELENSLSAMFFFIIKNLPRLSALSS